MPSAGPDTIVVGSGFGGSVWAAADTRFAERGCRVLHVEHGPYWACAAIPTERYDDGLTRLLGPGWPAERSGHDGESRTADPEGRSKAILAG
jgi:choline dehydrogenase-like flavoprotein